jgi:hypothetical protein
MKVRANLVTEDSEFASRYGEEQSHQAKLKAQRLDLDDFGNKPRELKTKSKLPKRFRR